MQIAAACGAIVLCLSVAKNYSMLFKYALKDLEQKETTKSYEYENNDLKASDDKEFVYNEDFNTESISVISNEIIQVDYNDGSNGITFRAGKGIENISGDYNVYQVKNTVKVNGINVNLEGSKNKEYNLAVWEKDGIAYSISAENAIDEKTILDMIS